MPIHATGLTIPEGWNQWPPAPEAAPAELAPEAPISPPPLREAVPVRPKPHLQIDLPSIEPLFVRRVVQRTLGEQAVDKIEELTHSTYFKATVATGIMTAIGLTLLFLLVSNPVGWLATGIAVSALAAKVIFAIAVVLTEALVIKLIHITEWRRPLEKQHLNRNEKVVYQRQDNERPAIIFNVTPPASPAATTGSSNSSQDNGPSISTRSRSSSTQVGDQIPAHIEKALAVPENWNFDENESGPDNEEEFVQDPLLPPQPHTISEPSMVITTIHHRKRNAGIPAEGGSRRAFVRRDAVYN